MMRSIKMDLHQILRRNALVVNHTANGLGEEVGHTELLHLGATLCVGDGVGEHNLLQRRVLHAL